MAEYHTTFVPVAVKAAGVSPSQIVCEADNTGTAVGQADTVTAQSAVLVVVYVDFAVITADPIPTAVTTPFTSTVATFVFDEDHNTVCGASAGNIVTVNGLDTSPLISESDVSLNVIVSTAGSEQLLTENVVSVSPEQPCSSWYVYPAVCCPSVILLGTNVSLIIPSMVKSPPAMFAESVTLVASFEQYDGSTVIVNTGRLYTVSVAVAASLVHPFTDCVTV